MAASCGEFKSWRELLKQHPISKYLRETIGSGASRHQRNDTESRICVHSSDLFIWNASEGCVLHCNLKAVATGSGETETFQQGVDASSFCNTQFQKLVPSDISNTEVQNISINQNGTHIILQGLRCTRVLELPCRWGKNAVFEGGKETISCRTIRINERLLNRSSSLKVLQARWHPGSSAGTHVAILTSDNQFRVYSIANGEQPISSVYINPGDMNTTEPASPGRSFVGLALGEVTVAFDFGVPLPLKAKQMGHGQGSSVPDIEVWPVYCVRGNGAVFVLYSYVSDIRSVSFPVQGPLAMFPPAEDNYGVDACSILVLPTPIPVVVVATCEGRLHHCVQLPGTDESSLLNESVNTSGIKRDVWSNLYEPVPEPYLYVIETAVLELCLALPQLEGASEVYDDFMCPIALQKDGNSPDRYHCSHAAGVHTVALPWLNSVQQFFLEEDQDFGITEEEECVVEHVLCTKPLYSCPTSPVLGLDVVTDPLLGATLLILDNNFEFTVLPIGLQYQVTGRDLEKAIGSSSGSVTNSESSNQEIRESFEKKIEQILQRKASVPILKAQAGSELSQKTMFQLLRRVTGVLREEYVHKHALAKQEIDTRVSALEKRKQHQKHDIQVLLESQFMLKENASAIAEKLQMCKDDHERLLLRLGACLRKIQSRVPVLTEAEKQEMKELNSIKANLDIYKQNIDQVRAKQEYQSRQMSNKGNSNSPALRQKQLSQIKDILKDESNDIEELKNDITRLNIGLS